MLLEAVGAPKQAQSVREAAQELLRLRFDAEQKKAQKPAERIDETTPATTRPGLKPWRMVVRPHPDVASGRYTQAEFAADRLPHDLPTEVFDLALAVYLATYHETTHALALVLGLDGRPDLGVDLGKGVLAAGEHGAGNALRSEGPSQRTALRVARRAAQAHG